YIRLHSGAKYSVEPYKMGLSYTGESGSVRVEETAKLPESFRLGRNYPNPFNPDTVIPFDLPHDSRVVMNVYSISGQLVRKLEGGRLAAGSHSVVWDGRDDEGKVVSSGVYLYTLRAEGVIIGTYRMAFVR
ncbi:MAG: FlgD immunoglobulin-like domain containing protein, partial [Candidatus Latescibacterota bacterium]